MARGRKRGPAARNRDHDGNFDAKKKSPTKNGSYSIPSPRKGREAQQQETVDEGIAATPHDTDSQAQVQNDDSIYASSPQNETSQTTASITPTRKNSAQSPRSNKRFADPSPGNLGTEQAGNPQTGPSSIPQSKVVVLIVPAHKLREIVEAHSAPERTVTFKVSPEQKSAKQPETSQGGEAAGMAPVKEKNPHDVLDGETICTKKVFISTMILITHGQIISRTSFKISTMLAALLMAIYQSPMTPYSTKSELS